MKPIWIVANSDSGYIISMQIVVGEKDIVTEWFKQYSRQHKGYTIREADIISLDNMDEVQEYKKLLDKSDELQRQRKETMAAIEALDRLLKVTFQWSYIFI